MTNTYKDKNDLESNKPNNQKPSFLEEILNNQSDNGKEQKSFRTKILQNFSKQKECDISWSRAF